MIEGITPLDSLQELGNGKLGNITNSNDDIICDDADDNVNALAGNDFVQGGGGRDTLAGGAGSDFLIDGIGDNTLLDSSSPTSTNTLDGVEGNNFLRIYAATTPTSPSSLLIGSNVNDQPPH